MSTAEEKAAYPRFLGKTVTPADNLFYHLIRVFHHAGRCADCGECERACPMDIPLRKLERKLQKEIKEIFGYEDEDIPFLAKLDIIPEGR
jgi:Na+-translocating ferredoxin:NAD+ oxidoreductase RnfC subunit